MNGFDLIVMVLVAVALIVGYGSGALPQVAGLGGAVAGGVIAIVALPLIETPLASLEPDTRAFAVLVGILFVVGAGEAVGSAAGRAAAIRLGQGVFGTLDRVLGGLVGAAQALLIAWLVGGLLAAGPVVALASQAQTSFIVRGLNTVLPGPTELAGELARLLDDTGLPDLFVGLEPLPAPPVDRPDDPEARAIAAIAEASTVRVAATTCQAISSGSGFVVAPGYVVTNAHVIAGAGTVRISVGGDAFDAVPVFLDPNLDAAVLWAPRLGAPALRFAARDPVRGTAGATLGYPHGGALRIAPAAVAGAYLAQGRDIYGRTRVTRSVLELRAEVDQGDSGGPLMLPDGTVGGVVFAEARTDDEVGYALTARSVATTIAPALGRTGAVATGSCIR